MLGDFWSGVTHSFRLRRVRAFRDDLRGSSEDVVCSANWENPIPWSDQSMLRDLSLRSVNTHNLHCFLLIWRHYRRRTANFDLYSALMHMAIKQWGFFNVPYILWQGHSLMMVIFENRDSHTYYWVFSSGPVTTWFYNFVLSRLGFEHATFCMRGEPTVPPMRLNYCCGYNL